MSWDYQGVRWKKMCQSIISPRNEWHQHVHMQTNQSLCNTLLFSVLHKWSINLCKDIQESYFPSYNSLYFAEDKHISDIRLLSLQWVMSKYLTLFKSDCEVHVQLRPSCTWDQQVFFPMLILCQSCPRWELNLGPPVSESRIRTTTPCSPFFKLEDSSRM